MRLEFHQLERRWEHLRVRHPARQRQLLASLAETGQQTPIVVVAAEGQPDRYVVIDGQPELFFKTQRPAQKKAPAGAAAELMRELEMVAAIVNRAQRRLAGAAAAELDGRQREAARRQIERLQNQLRHLDEKLLPEQEPHVEPSATHHDSGTEGARLRCHRD